MKEYHKINSVFKRGANNQFIIGDWAQNEFNYLQNNEWEFTEKVDGTNIRIEWDGANRKFGGRTENAQIPATLIQRLENLFPVEKFSGLDPMILFGEGYGPKIQKGGGNYGPIQDFILFDVMIGDWFLRRPDIEDIAKKFSIDVVPILGTGNIAYAIAKVRAGFKSKWGDFIAEGLVIRPIVELKDRAGRRIITKIKHRDFK